ncbi:hypothetical protein AMECASPLE_026014 [Ameca splendens]|uniref:Uncharacterized protein n=1 Tax=Ameca splendens TaxID=208324 RepID=A0ABV1AB49_9TELE
MYAGEDPPMNPETPGHITPPASTHKRNRAHTTEHHAHKGPEDHTPRQKKPGIPTSTEKTSARTRHIPLHLGPGHGGSRRNRDAEASLSSDTSSSAAGGSQRGYQASRET